MNIATVSWQGIALLPFIDASTLNAAVTSVDVSQFTAGK